MNMARHGLAMMLLLIAANAFAAGDLRFREAGQGFDFDTGALRGTLHANGRGIGLLPLIDAATSTPLARSVGVFSHYRLLDDTARYGKAGWEWASQARLLEDGAVRVNWTADAEHPFDMQATYRWAAPDTLDLETVVNAKKPLRRFEVFLASYFEGFPRAFALAKQDPAVGQRLVEATQAEGPWQTWTRDAGGAAFFGDGRWQRPPNPVEWIIKGRLANPLAVRRDEPRGLAALVMAPREDCFAVSMPYGEEAHRSIYLSLVGKDLMDGESARARARLVIAKGLSDGDAIARYLEFIKSLK